MAIDAGMGTIGQKMGGMREQTCDQVFLASRRILQAAWADDCVGDAIVPQQLLACITAQMQKQITREMMHEL